MTEHFSLSELDAEASSEAAMAMAALADAMKSFGRAARAAARVFADSAGLRAPASSTFETFRLSEHRQALRDANAKPYDGRGVRPTHPALRGRRR